jgi:SAM-dependent MidA family methyltransferase
VGEAAESVGNVVSLRKHQSLADAYIELLSTVEFSIDRHGNLSIPELGGGSPDLQQRFQAMLQEQGPEFFQWVEAIAREKALAAIKREQERLARYKTAI